MEPIDTKRNTHGQNTINKTEGGTDISVDQSMYWTKKKNNKMTKSVNKRWVEKITHK